MFRPAVVRPRAETNQEHERVRTQRLPVGRRSQVLDINLVGASPSPSTRRWGSSPGWPTHAARTPVSDPEPGGPAPPRTVRGLSADRASRIGAAIRRDHGRGNAAGRIKEEIDSRTARATRPPAPRIHFRDQHPRYGAKGARPPTPTGHRAGAREQCLPTPAAGRRPRYRPAPAANDQHDTNRFAGRLRPEHRARCCRRLRSGPLAATGPTLVSRAHHSAVAQRTRPPPHEHAGSGPAAEGGRPQVRTTDPSTWIGSGTTMLDRSAHRHRAPSRCNPERRVSTGNPDG